MSFSKESGDAGERAARKYLFWHGYRLLEKNYRSRHGEIDIICRRGRLIVFVEVKTRSGNNTMNYGEAAAAVNKTKRQHIIYTARSYINEKSELCSDKDFRFDVIEVYQNLKKHKINHIESAFRADGN